MADVLNSQVVYIAPPVDRGLPDPAVSFEIARTPFDPETVELGAGEVLVKNRYLSIDPYHRFGLYDPRVSRSHFPATAIGTVIGTFGISDVIRSNNDAFHPGDVVYGWVRWETFTRVQAANTQYLEVVRADLDPIYYLGPLGTPGLTGYGGLTQVGKPKSGETILVSGTTGAVGMVVAQTAKKLGLRVVGAAATVEKASFLTDELGLDAAINYRNSTSLDEALSAACPEGIDIYFDLVGGEMLDAALLHMNQGGRIPAPGMASQYNLPPEKRYGIRNLHAIIGNDITIQSYRNDSFVHLLPEMRDRLAAWLKDGSMKFRNDVSYGVEAIPAGLADLFTGGRFGKKIVATATDQATTPVEIA